MKLLIGNYLQQREEALSKVKPTLLGASSLVWNRQSILI